MSFVARDFTQSTLGLEELVDLCNNSGNNICVVRLTSNTYKGMRGVHTDLNLFFEKRKSTGLYWFEEDVKESDAYHIMDSIVNINECKDGFYTISICDIICDTISGEVLDYSYSLSPFKAV